MIISLSMWSVSFPARMESQAQVMAIMLMDCDSRSGLTRRVGVFIYSTQFGVPIANEVRLYQLGHRETV